MRRESKNPSYSLSAVRLLPVLLGLALTLLVSVGARTAHARAAPFVGLHDPMGQMPDVLTSTI